VRLFGATVTYAKEADARKAVRTELDTGILLFRSCPKKTLVARYHSLAAEKNTNRQNYLLRPYERRRSNGSTAQGVSGVWSTVSSGSIMTPDGKTMLENLYKGV
jgi:anthranilate synthase component 2